MECEEVVEDEVLEEASEATEEDSKHEEEAAEDLEVVAEEGFLKEAADHLAKW